MAGLEHVMNDWGQSPGSEEYLKKREAQERALAERAADRGARRSHLAMADRYAELARQNVAMPQPPISTAA